MHVLCHLCVGGPSPNFANSIQVSFSGVDMSCEEVFSSLIEAIFNLSKFKNIALLD